MNHRIGFSAVFTFLVAGLALGDVLERFKPSLQPEYAEYMAICKRWLDGGRDPKSLNLAIEEFTTFGERNADNVFYARAMFNIAQIYDHHLIVRDDAVLYYQAALDSCLVGLRQWTGRELVSAQVNGAKACLRLSTLAFRDRDTTGTLAYMDLLFDEFADQDDSTLVTRVLVAEADCDPSLVPNLKPVCEIVLRKYSGPHKRSVLGDVLRAYLMMAERDIIKVAECRLLAQQWLAETQGARNLVEEEVHLKRLEYLEQTKIKNKLKPISIQELPRLPK